MIESELFQRIKQTKEVDDHELSEIEKEVQAQFDAGNWENVLEWRDLIFYILETANAWEKALTINALAKDAARFSGKDIHAARFTHDEANILSRKGHFPEAILLYQESFKILERFGEHNLATASLHMLSLAKRAVGAAGKAESLAKECLRRADVYQMGSWRAHPLHVLAWIARDKRDFKTAIRYLLEAAAIHEASQDNDRAAMLAQSYYDIAQIYVWSREVDQAEKYLSIADQWDEQAGRFEGTYKSEKLMGDLLMLKGETREAILQYHQALDVAELGPDERRVANLYLDLAQAYFRAGEFCRALEYLRDGISQARLLGLFTPYKTRLGILFQWRTLFYSFGHKRK